MPSGYQPKHLAAQSYVSWRSTARGRVLHTATAAVMAGLLAFPGTAFAASEIGVGEDRYTEAANGAGTNGGSWSWDGANDMVLDNYDGGSISTVGELTINLVGDNTIRTEVAEHTADEASGIYAVADDSGNDVVITGDGSLDITASEDIEKLEGDSVVWGIYGGGVNVTLDGAEVNIDYTNTDLDSASGIVTEALGEEGAGNINIKNGSKLVVNVSEDAVNNGAGAWGGVDAWDGVITIADSTVDVNAKGGYAIYGLKNDLDDVKSTDAVGVDIVNSSITAIGTDHGIYSTGGISIVNSDVNAQGVEWAASDDTITAQAQEGASKGAGIAAQGAITLSNVRGASVAVDEYGVSYVVGEGGSTSVSVKHTGEASKFVNGVGREKTPTTGGDAVTSVAAATALGAKRLASTGGGISELVTAVTSDPTSFAAAVSATVAGLGFTAAGIRRRRS